MQLVLHALNALAKWSHSTKSRLDGFDSKSTLNLNDSDLPWPGLPITSVPSSASYWSAHYRGGSNALIGMGKNDELPASADVVIVGAGISGATVAHFLVNSGKNPDSIVMLEAREVSSGATGRNGGFIKPVPFRTYGDYKALFGTEEALHLIQSEYDALDLTAELVEEGNLDVGYALRPHREMVLDNSTARHDESLLHLIRKDREAHGLPHIDNVHWYHDTNDAQQITRSRTAVEAYAYSCGTIWPLRFVHALLSKILSSPGSKRLRLFTHTPATHISRSSSSGQWTIKTPRGSISTPKLILTTNGHTSTLLPEIFMHKIIPKRTQMAALTPPASFGPPLEFTFNIRGVYDPSIWSGRTNADGEEVKWPGGFEEAYGMTTPDGTMVLGGALAQRAAGEGVEWMGESDDSVVFEKTTEYFRHMPRVNFANWDAEGEGEGLFRTWTGIQGHTIDTLPFVGTLPSPDYAGLYISAGFDGHGMARCIIASRGLVHQLLSPNNEWDERVPRSYAITSERLNVTAEEVLGRLIEGRKALGLVDIPGLRDGEEEFEILRG